MPNELPPTFERLRQSDLQRPEILGFSCGENPWEIEVTEYLTSGSAWEERKNARTYLYCPIEESGQPVGFVSFAKTNQRYPSPTSETRLPCMLIAWLAVDSRYQRRGYANTMLQAIAQLAIDTDREAIVLYVHRRNAAAIALYEHKGFVRYAENEPSEGFEDYIRMILFLK